MRVSIIGSGIVGGRMGEFLAKRHQVTFYDVSEKRIEELRAAGHDATTDLRHALLNTDLSIVAVPTNTMAGALDMDPAHLLDVATKSGDILKEKKGYHVFAFKSTMVPTTTEKLIIPMLEKRSGKSAHKEFGVVFTPEFLTEIAGSWLTELKAHLGPSVEEAFTVTPDKEPRLVIGEGPDARAGDAVLALLTESFTRKPPVMRTDYRTSEMIKYASNCALATRISYWNEIYAVCERLGIDPKSVALEVGRDPRIGFYGTIAGKAFGGKCLPKDLKALIALSKGIGVEPTVLTAVHDVNERLRKERGSRE
ncbi:MAG: UDP-glucose/GDP-mannose dehydrogenase family protein [Candidatus Aenigmarchaeota archaeon]|nr:UDP-glucose/GDP-mannose dehydrogenase family protein [Candidatus Aenigmarchaeota archaeon]